MESARGWRLAAVFIALLVLIVGVWMATRSRQQKPQTKVNEVTLTRGDVSITVTREGAMTVRTPEGLFEQQWDEQRVRAFFAQFESEDFSRSILTKSSSILSDFSPMLEIIFFLLQ